MEGWKMERMEGTEEWGDRGDGGKEEEREGRHGCLDLVHTLIPRLHPIDRGCAFSLSLSRSQCTANQKSLLCFATVCLTVGVSRSVRPTFSLHFWPLPPFTDCSLTLHLPPCTLLSSLLQNVASPPHARGHYPGLFLRSCPSLHNNLPPAF